MAERYKFENQTLELIEKLKIPFGVYTNAEVINRAWALAEVVAEQADDQHTVVIVGRDEPVKVNLTE